MKAAVFYQATDLRILDVPKPTPKAGEVLLKVKACGICGTDVHIYHGDEGAAATPAGTVLGHEFSGIVEAVGEGVTSVKVYTMRERPSSGTSPPPERWKR